MAQRDAVWTLSPPWLRTGWGERYMYNFGLISDAVLERLEQGMLARMPTYCDASTLPIIGADRLMPQGPFEDIPTYRVRLQRAFDSWQRAGSSEAVLQQALYYVSRNTYGPPHYTPLASIVGIDGSIAYAHWHTFYNDTTLTADDPIPIPAYKAVSPANWNWDGNYWPHNSWLILYFPFTEVFDAGGATGSIGASGDAGFPGLSPTGSATDEYVGKILHITGAASADNNGYFLIDRVDISGNIIFYGNSLAVTPDANNGSITWEVLDNYGAGIRPRPAWDSPNAPLNWDDEGNCWDLEVDDVDDPTVFFDGLRSLVRQWKAKSTHYPVFIISFAGGDGTPTDYEFSPYASAPGDGTPDGTWGTCHKTVDGVVVPARDTERGPSRFDAFLDGTATYILCNEPMS